MLSKCCRGTPYNIQYSTYIHAYRRFLQDLPLKALVVWVLPLLL